MHSALWVIQIFDYQTEKKEEERKGDTGMINFYMNCVKLPF